MKLRVLFDNRTEEYDVTKGESVLNVLQQNHIEIDAPCGGNGSCGKCRVKVAGEKEWRLACRLVPEHDMTVELPPPDGTASIVTERFINRIQNGADETEQTALQDGYGIAIDIGTTTIALELISCREQKTIAVEAKMNEQRIYGADVISRIRAANEGKDRELCNRIRSCLTDGIRYLLDKAKIPAKEVREIVVAANTTMVHLLLHFPCDKLGEYPFRPHSLQAEIRKAGELFAVEGLDCKVLIFPGISAFVGGDIVAGLFSENFLNREERTFFLDLGTNGEMVIGNREHLITASAAAGPAFEGGGLSWGTGSIPGAVCGFSLSGGKRVRTIGDQAPCGICGSGAVEIIAELLNAGFVDETGLLVEEYFETGYPVAENEAGEMIYLSQKDIREFQMAKAAIRAGIEILSRKSGIPLSEIDSFVIAGGFGFYLNLDKACRIGLLPKQCRDRMHVSGNTSLAGAAKALFTGGIEEETDCLRSRVTEVNLAEEGDFQEIYMEQMYF